MLRFCLVVYGQGPFFCPLANTHLFERKPLSGSLKTELFKNSSELKALRKFYLFCLCV